jgi:peptidoglycan-N-acetylglucosamine deacetylase
MTTLVFIFPDIQLLTTLSVDIPSKKKYATCISFDFDAISLWIGSFKQITPAEISRGEFGAIGALRILDLLDKYSIKSTFFVPGQTAEIYPEIVKKISSRGHEVAHHNYLHETPQDLTLREERKVIRKGIDSLRSITGERPLGYRAPAFEPSWNTMEILRNEDFVYDSSMMAHDYLPYKIRIGDTYVKGSYRFGKESKLIEIPVSWTLDDFPHFEHLLNYPGSGLHSASSVLENWIRDFDYMCEHFATGVYNIVFHPQVTGRGHRIMVLENLIQHIQKRNDVWFAKLIDVANACKP